MLSEDGGVVGSSVDVHREGKRNDDTPAPDEAGNRRRIANRRAAPDGACPFEQVCKNHHSSCPRESALQGVFSGCQEWFSELEQKERFGTGLEQIAEQPKT